MRMPKLPHSANGYSMSASVPWSVNAVEPETWAAARDAARRQGLSVGEWLDTAIRECAAANERSPRPLRGADRLEQRLDDIADKLEHFSRYSSGGRSESSLHSSIESLNERIDALMRERNSDRNAPAEVRSAIQRLDDRIEEMFSRARLASTQTSPDLERRLETISRTIETMSRKLEQENIRYMDYSIPPTVADLDQAVADIMMRQSALDGTPMPPLQRERQTSMPMYSPASDYGGIESQLRNLTAEMNALRKSGLQSESIDGLRKEISELASKLGELAPRRSLEALEHAVETLVNRIDRGAIGAGSHNSGEIAQTLEEIRQAIASVRPAESFASVERELVELSRKLDRISTHGADNAAIERLQEQAAEIRDMLAGALPADMLKALCSQIELLVRKFESAPTPDAAIVDVMSAFDRRIEALSQRIEQASQLSPAAPDFVEIRSRLDDLMHSIGKSGQAASTSMESGLRALSDKLDAAESRLSVLSVIEKNVKDLFAQMKEVRSAAVPAVAKGEPSNDYADRPARPAVPSSVIEAEMRKQVAHSEPAAIPGEVLKPEAEPSEQAEAPKAPPHPLRSQVHVRSEPRLNAALPRSERIIDLPNDIPPDFPLEPGSGSPRHRASQTPAQRIAQSEAALGGIGQSEQPSRATDYIAAARRAAQSAAAEPDSLDKKKGALTEEGKKKSGLLITRGRQAFLFALTAFLLIFTAMRYFDHMIPALPFTQSNVRPPVQEPAQPAPESPSAPAPVSAPEKNSVLPALQQPSFLPTTPAGVLVDSKNNAVLASPPQTDKESEVTGSVRTARPAAPVQTASVPAGKEAAPARGDELPATIGGQGLRAAAVSGDPVAAYEIGSRYLEGRGVPVNTAEAIRWFERAIQKGSAPAAYRMGGMHEKGQGFPRDPREAKRYYAIAAEAGHIKAMHNLAVLYSEGVEGTPDYKTAARWFRMASERGVADSQYNLGVLYARGLGVEQNLTESYRWFALAAQQGDVESGKKRDDVAKRLDPQTLVAARLAVQTWSPAPVDAAANSTQLNPEWETGAAPPRRRAVKK